MNRSIEQIRWNVANGVSSHDDVKTILGRYDEVLASLADENYDLYQHYQDREKKAE